MKKLLLALAALLIPAPAAAQSLPVSPAPTAQCATVSPVTTSLNIAGLQKDADCFTAAATADKAAASAYTKAASAATAAAKYRLERIAQLKTCPDGKVILKTATCPATTKTCPDGTVIPIANECPPVPCPDGTSVPNGQTCPPVNCPDGTKVPNGQTCPPVSCPDGTKVPNGQTCPPVKCPDGTQLPNGSTCPPPKTGPEADIPDNFDLSGWLVQGENLGLGAIGEGAFRFTCEPGHIAKDDPIVYPGQPGRSHAHQFFGNTGTDANSNYQSLRTTGGSTCTRSAGTSPQRSAYWMPAMLDGAGNYVKPDWMNTYYKQHSADDPECAKTVFSMTNYTTPGPNIGRCGPIPNGLRFILGYDMGTMKGGPMDLSSRDSSAMGFECVQKLGSPGLSYPGNSLSGLHRSMASIVAQGKCPVGSWLRVYLAFPQCWNAKDLDSPNHRDHVSFPPQSRCPQTHPYKFSEVAISAYFTVDANFVAGRWLFSSDKQHIDAGMNVVPGETLHMDYWEAWSPTVKKLWETNCIGAYNTIGMVNRPGPKSCSDGNVGDGRKIKGMGQIGPRPEHVLVPVASIP